MANKKQSQAQIAANAAKTKKTQKKGSTAKKPVEKPSSHGKKSVTPAERAFPTRFISSAVFLALFILFLVIFLKPEGVVITFLESLIHGLLGRAGFIISIPALLYLFIIHAFSGKRPIIMRSICLGVFVICCGCIFHLAKDTSYWPNDLSLVTALYSAGNDGTSGGLLCGLLAMLLDGLFGKVISFIVLVVSAVFTLLGGMQITLTSIIRAVQNRPRAQWEEEREERQEPATVVVNHIANKRIHYIENKRNRATQQDAQEVLSDATETGNVTNTTDTKESAKENKVSDMIRQIDGEIETPVAVARETEPVSSTVEESLIKEEKKIEPFELVFSESSTELASDPVPAEMPPLLPQVPSSNAKREQAPAVAVKKVKVTAKEAETSAVQVAKEIEKGQAQDIPAYQYPPIDLLKEASGGGADGTAEMRENSRRLNETLASFKIEAHIINVTRGPSVTRYEVELEKGVRLSKLTTAADDIALSLGATGVRIAAVPGKISVVGIEVPNRAVTMVSLREVIDSSDFAKAKSKSSFAVGKDIGGSCIVGNIARLPHMLIAGTTGSGKSVCMNSIIISLLYKASPDEVKLIMVDPKMVELGVYNGIPHLLIPVVTDPKKAAGSLQWAVTEMMRRYKAMSDIGVRDLESYNSIVEGQNEGNKLPQVVVIIDELADLMLVAAKEVEESICRIAQMGRAAGIHLVIATQRPSADVITGLMKANIPSRIAFAVASAMESRIILDTQGAEKLVGKGDMLYAPIGSGKPKRVQGCYVDESEVEAVASFVKTNCVTNYDQDVMEEIERKAQQTGNKTAAEPAPNQEEIAGDEMLPAAVEVILETKQASVSMLQRRLKLGYARAARIVDEMEEKGIVGPFQGSKPREILITKEQWEAMRSGQVDQMGFDDLDEYSETEDEVY